MALADKVKSEVVTVGSIVADLKGFVGNPEGFNSNEKLKATVKGILNYIGRNDIEVVGLHIFEIIGAISNSRIEEDKTLNEINLANQQKEKDVEKMQSKVDKAKIDELQALLDDIKTTSAIDEKWAQKLVAEQISDLKKKYSNFNEQEIRKVVAQKLELQKQVDKELSQKQPELDKNERRVMAEAMAEEKIIRAEIIREAEIKGDISTTKERIAKLDEETKTKMEIDRVAVSKAEQIITELEEKGRSLTGAQREIAIDVLEERIRGLILDERSTIEAPVVAVENGVASVGPTLQQELVARAKLLEKLDLKESIEKVGKEIEGFCESELVVKAKGENLEREVTLEILNSNSNVDPVKAKDLAVFVREFKYPTSKQDSGNKLSAKEERLIATNAVFNLTDNKNSPGKIEENANKWITLRKLIYSPIPIASQIEAFKTASDSVGVLPTNEKIRTQVDMLSLVSRDPKLKNMLGSAQASVKYINQLKSSNSLLMRKFGNFLGASLDKENSLKYINAIAMMGKGDFAGAIGGILGGFGEVSGGAGWAAGAMKFIGTNISNPAVAGALNTGISLISAPGGLIGGGLKALGGMFGKKAAGTALVSGRE